MAFCLASYSSTKLVAKSKRANVFELSPKTVSKQMARQIDRYDNFIKRERKRV